MKIPRVLEKPKKYIKYKAQGGKLTYKAWKATMELRGLQ